MAKAEGEQTLSSLKARSGSSFQVDLDYLKETAKLIPRVGQNFDAYLEDPDFKESIHETVLGDPPSGLILSPENNVSPLAEINSEMSRWFRDQLATVQQADLDLETAARLRIILTESEKLSSDVLRKHSRSYSFWRADIVPKSFDVKSGLLVIEKEHQLGIFKPGELSNTIDGNLFIPRHLFNLPPFCCQTTEVLLNNSLPVGTHPSTLMSFAGEIPARWYADFLAVVAAKQAADFNGQLIEKGEKFDAQKHALKLDQQVGRKTGDLRKVLNQISVEALEKIYLQNQGNISQRETVQMFVKAHQQLGIPLEAYQRKMFQYEIE